ncbi:very short patch repair endonuclease [Mycobacterium angelicum]|uniref:Very short patch repair endonuclease n=1 Tax=Mycobacterium angelicum TaxID=470074 RepID=A0A1W9ZUE8_MYCAN|nr:very short patch repair endonuclease [Mycobacterium angelicum]MCV7199968.1 very short patch repair endonuclease [Mycobacterium angelicum]ORA21381.1 very short patch repair endonuclease [Mycobacterium angelicum]
MSRAGRPVLDTTPATSQRMSAQSSQDTKIEVQLRSLLHGRGLRYRVHQRPLRGLRRAGDVVFSRAKVAVFVDGCFWHGCPTHGTWPKRNSQFWREKIEANVRRDRDTDAALKQAGWVAVRVWEHEDPAEAADRVTALVRARAQRTPTACPTGSRSARQLP